METFEGWSEPNEEDTFKSYYVVWKHARGERMYKNMVSLNRTMQYGNITVFFFFFFSTAPDMFKSYYVVWKRIFECWGNSRNIRFKSYYVVWKRN